jgi:hypothetical protein
MDCLPYLLRVEQIELGRRRRRKLMAALTQQSDGHPPENSRGPRDQDAHAAHVNDTAHGRIAAAVIRGASTRIRQVMEASSDRVSSVVVESSAMAQILLHRTEVSTSSGSAGVVDAAVTRA